MKTVLSLSKRILFDEKAREGTGRVGLRETFKLPPGQYVAKALVTIHGSSAVGFMRGEFTVEPEGTE